MSVKDLLMGAAGSASVAYVDDVFSTYLYDGTGATLTITNGIDLSNQGGLVWIKRRSGTADHFLYDTLRGTTADINSNTTDLSSTVSGTLTAFNNNGFTLGFSANVNSSSHVFTSWTFRKAPKFFDLVSYTGTGVNRVISHSLGQVPGMIAVKRTDISSDWKIYHRSLANTEYLILNSPNVKATDTTLWNSTTATTTNFSLGTDATVNANGGTYVAYLFSHDTATDGLIQFGY
jgi:hypothetical protein